MSDKKEKIEEVLNRGVEKVYPSKKALRDALPGSKKLRIYQGFDPSMPNLHLGHLVGILKLKQLQDLGHEVIFLVGDFTGMIGDPTDRISARKKLTRRQVLQNAKNWKQQAARFLKFSGKNPAKIMFNSSWLDKISFKDLIEITSHFTVQRLLERDFFKRRMEGKRPIFLHEFLYPVAQAIDCVKMDVDMEIGGSDQTFNMLMGRHLMKTLEGKEKFVLTTKLLVDKEGQKVGKTTGTALFLNASPIDMFGKVMAFPDEAIIPGFELLTAVAMQQITVYQKELQTKKINPMELKQVLASEIVRLNYGESETKKAEQEFERIFKQKRLPEKILGIKIARKVINILDLLVEARLVSSKSEAKRLVLQGGVKINKKLQKDWRETIRIEKGMVVQVGKRRFKRIV